MELRTAIIEPLEKETPKNALGGSYGKCRYLFQAAIIPTNNPAIKPNCMAVTIIALLRPIIESIETILEMCGLLFMLMNYKHRLKRFFELVDYCLSHTNLVKFHYRYMCLSKEFYL